MRSALSQRATRRFYLCLDHIVIAGDYGGDQQPPIDPENKFHVWFYRVSRNSTSKRTPAHSIVVLVTAKVYFSLCYFLNVVVVA